MDCTEDDTINSIWEEARKEVPYENQLEQQKIFALTRKEIEDWKRIGYGIERYRKQYLSEDRCVRKKERELYKLTERLCEPHLDIIIDQHLEKWMKEDGKPTDYQPEIERMRAKINRMKQRLLAYEQSYEQIQKSKSHQMAKEVARKVREEERKVDERQEEINGLWKTRRAESNEEWEKEKNVYVKFCELYTDFEQREMDHEATLQNNEIKKAKILQLYEDIKLAKIEQEEEAKRREIELSERLLIPGRIQHMTLGETVFKDPNDFPILIDKIESTRKSYEQIFKRPEYMDLRKLRKKNRKNLTKSSAQFALLFGGSKRKDRSRRAATQMTVSPEVTQPTINEVITPEPIKPKQPVPPVKSPISTSSSESVTIEVQQTPLPQTQEEVPKDAPPEATKQDTETRAIEERQKPVCNVQGQQIDQSYAESRSQPVICAGKIEKGKSNEKPRKRPSIETSTPSSAPPCLDTSREPNPKKKPKKVVFREPEESTFEFDSDTFSFSPEKSNRKTRATRQEPSSHTSSQNAKSQATTETMEFEYEPQQKAIDEDNFSFGSASPPQEESRRSKEDCDFLDSVSLSGGSISSFDMEDRESGSDLGFDLSPIGSRANNCRAGGSGGASNEDNSDFDFLASPPKSSGQSGRKGRDSFDLMDTDDSGTGFDFF